MPYGNSSGINYHVSRTSALGKTRKDVRFGEIFSYLKRDHSLKPLLFAALGASDRIYSVKLGDGNVNSGALSGTDTSKGKKPVAVRGTWSFNITLFRNPSDYKKVHRRHLMVGQVFCVNQTGAKYIHMGTLNNGRFLAVNVDRSDYATTEDGDKEVVLIGTSAMNVNLTK